MIWRLYSAKKNSAHSGQLIREGKTAEAAEMIALKVADLGLDFTPPHRFHQSHP